MYDKVVTKINKTDTSRFVLKTKSVLEKKNPDTSELVKKANYNNKITEIEYSVLVVQVQTLH